ncbi:MAG: hypothetical protein GY899_02940 [Verrucomicrobiaceae bacterium]|nr:hypothetical protein [Verrucomicrobiaceae bacterium]
MIITRYPWLWRKLYQLADTIPVGESPINFTRSVGRRLADYLNSSHPAVLISTYPLYGHLVSRLFGNRNLPFGLLTVVTDSTTINRAWLHGGDGHYAVTDNDSANFFLENGIPENRVHVTGFPVDPCFSIQPRPATASPLRILYTPSTGTSNVEKKLQAIQSLSLRHKLPLELTVVLGRHEQRLRHTVEACAPENTHIIGWTDDMPELLSKHHLLIGKAGGASVHEALAAGCPMLIDYVVPGQEEGNALKLQKHKAGLIVKTPNDITTEILSLTENSAQRLRSMSDSALKHSQPGAACKVATLAMDIAKQKGHQLTLSSTD